MRGMLVLLSNVRGSSRRKGQAKRHVYLVADTAGAPPLYHRPRVSRHASPLAHRVHAAYSNILKTHAPTTTTTTTTWYDDLTTRSTAE